MFQVFKRGANSCNLLLQKIVALKTAPHIVLHGAILRNEIVSCIITLTTIRDSTKFLRKIKIKIYTEIAFIIILI